VRRRPRLAPAAQAGSRTTANVALGLASFAVFNQVVGGFVYPRYVYAAPAYYPAHYPAYSERVVVVERPHSCVYPVYVQAPCYSAASR
jgi:hypothetical protein